MPKFWVSKDPKDDIDEFKKYLATPPGFIEGLTQTYDDDEELVQTNLYDYQKEFMNCPAFFRHIDKSRQTGYSFIFACEGLAHAMLDDRFTAIYVSYNEDEAKEKVRYGRELYYSLPKEYRLARKLVVDNKTSLEFDTGKTNTNRLISHPQTPPRGKGGGVYVYLDEFAIYRYDKEIYTAALPVIIRGKGRLTCASTPFGKKGIHYDISSNRDNSYKNYTRFKVNWWDCPQFCKNIERAKVDAPFMTTQERVNEFGTFSIKHQYNNFDLLSFQQEFELLYVDESVSFYPLDLINSCAYVSKGGKGIPMYKGIPEIQRAIALGHVGNRLIAGFDIGESIDSSEIIILEEDLKKETLKLPGK